MTTQESFNYQAALKCIPHNRQNPELFLDFKSNIRNALRGYMKSLLRLLDAVMEHPESTREGSAHE